VQEKLGSNGIFFMVDVTLSPSELKGLKETLLKVIEKLPHNIHGGLLAFNRNVFVFDSEGEFTSLNGSEGTQCVLRLRPSVLYKTQVTARIHRCG
jgi:hypothetical protein